MGYHAAMQKEDEPSHRSALFSNSRTVEVGGYGSHNFSDASVYLAVFAFLDLPLPLASTLPSAGLTRQAVKM